MCKPTRRHFTAFLSFILAVSLSLAPVAHASLALSEVPSNTSAELGHPCEESIADAASQHQHQPDGNGAQNLDCDHGTTCKVLCSVSVSVMPGMDFLLSSFEKSNRWSPAEISAHQSLFLSRLDKPPKL